MDITTTTDCKQRPLQELIDEAEQIRSQMKNKALQKTKEKNFEKGEK